MGDRRGLRLGVRNRNVVAFIVRKPDPPSCPRTPRPVHPTPSRTEGQALDAVSADLVTAHLRSRTSFPGRSTVARVISHRRGMGEHLVREGIRVTSLIQDRGTATRGMGFPAARNGHLGFRLTVPTR